MSSLYIPKKFLISSLAGLTAASAGSPEGDWNAFNIQTPKNLDINYVEENGDTPGYVELQGGWDFEVHGPESLSVNAAGQFNGGSISFLTDTGRTKVISDGKTEYLWRNANEDVLMGSKYESPSAGGSQNWTQVFSIVLREPTTLSEEDLLGDWQAVRMQVPKNITFDYDEVIEANELAGHYQFDIESFEITFSTHLVDDQTEYRATINTDEVGTYSTPSNDTVALSFGINPKINASKTVMVATESEGSISDPDNASQVLLIFIKKSSVAATEASLAGLWGHSNFDTPLFYEAYNAEQIDPSGGYQFDAEALPQTVTPFGTVKDARGGASFELKSAGYFTATEANEPASHVYYTQDQQIMLAWHAIDTKNANTSRIGFSMLTRYERPLDIAFNPEDPTEIAITIPDGMNLEKSSTLGDWDNVTPSDDGAHIENTEPGSAFYRVVPQQD